MACVLPNQFQPTTIQRSKRPAANQPEDESPPKKHTSSGERCRRNGDVLTDHVTPASAQPQPVNATPEDKAADDEANESTEGADVEEDPLTWLRVPKASTPHLRLLQTRGQFPKAIKIEAPNAEPCWVLPYIYADDTFVCRLLRTKAGGSEFRPDYDAEAAAVVYNMGQIRLGDERCSACIRRGQGAIEENTEGVIEENTKDAEEDAQGDTEVPVPFLCCATAGEFMDGVCAPCIAMGGSRLEKIQRCSRAVMGMTLERSLDPQLPAFCGVEALFLGEDSEMEAFLRAAFEMDGHT